MCFVKYFEADTVNCYFYLLKTMYLLQIFKYNQSYIIFNTNGKKCTIGARNSQTDI